MRFRTVIERRFSAVLCLVLTGLSGCAAFYPMNGVPARYLPVEMKAPRRNGQRTIDLSLLNQRWDGIHRVDSGDVLGIYIGGVLGKIDENPQVQFPQQNSDFLPSAGVPVTVREDGTISLPMIGSLSVRGKSTRETEEAIRNAYTNHAAGKEYLPPGRERILVSLVRPRQVRVLVVRQDSRMEPTANAMVGMVNLGTSKRGSGKAVSLPAYKNDVLNALIATDGLPGLDAENAVYIIRRNPDLPGGDRSLPPPFDPEQFIREMKAHQKPVIRGQNSDNWNYRRPSNAGRVNSYAPAYADYRQSARQSASPQYDSNQPASIQQAYSTLPSPGWNQNAFATGQNPGAGVYDLPANQDYAASTSVEPTQYQSQQYASNPNWAYPAYNGGYPGTNSSPHTPWSPTPLANPTPINTVPTQNSAITPQPRTSNLSPTNQPPFNPSPQPVYQPYGNSALPHQGYALPEPISPALQQPTDNAPANQFGGYGDPLPVEKMNPGGEGIAIADGRRIIRIPIRLGPDEQIDLKNEDVILNEGDIVFVESRDAEVFFTGGLLGGGQYSLPRDSDLDIIRALSIASSRNMQSSIRAMGGVSSLNSDVTVSPSSVIVLRKLPEGGEIPIKINLYEARTDLSERIYVQPGDYIYLQYTPLEAVAAFIDRHLIEGALFGLIAQQATFNRTGN